MRICMWCALRGRLIELELFATTSTGKTQPYFYQCPQCWRFAVGPVT